MNKHACFTQRLGWGSVFALMLFLSVPVFGQDEAPPQSAQGPGRSHLNLQGTVPVLNSNMSVDSSGNPLSNDPTRSAGFLVGYSFALNNRFRVEADYGASRNAQRFTGNSGTTELQGDVNQMTVEMEYALFKHSSRFVPYVLAGTGAVMFAPTDFTRGTVAGVQSQSKPVFVYGGGVDFALTHNMGVRTEYRGLLTTSPNFDLPALGSPGKLNIVEPTVGLYFKF